MAHSYNLNQSTRLHAQGDKTLDVLLLLCSRQLCGSTFYFSPYSAVGIHVGSVSVVLFCGVALLPAQSQLSQTWHLANRNLVRKPSGWEREKPRHKQKQERERTREEWRERESGSEQCRWRMEKLTTKTNSWCSAYILEPLAFSRSD